MYYRDRKQAITLEKKSNIEGGTQKGKGKKNVNTLYIYFIQTGKWYIKGRISTTVLDKSPKVETQTSACTVISQTRRFEMQGEKNII